MEYWPVDSGKEASWQQMVEGHKAGTLGPDYDRAYCQSRPILELFDQDADPGELHNLAGKPELRDIQQTLMVVLREKPTIP